MARGRLLISLEHVSLNSSAGAPGLGFCTVRLLDDVTLSIFDGDLVLLRGGFDHGSAALLRVLADDDRMRSRMLGRRLAVPELITRSGSIPVNAIGKVLHGWTRSASGSAKPALVAETHPSVIYLLRATRAGVEAGAHLQGWESWSNEVQRRGGTVVIAEEASLLRHETLSVPFLPKSENSRLRSWYDGASTRWSGDTVNEAPNVCRCLRPVVRILQLGFGRLYGEQTHSPRLCHHCRQRLTSLPT